MGVMLSLRSPCLETDEWLQLAGNFLMTPACEFDGQHAPHWRRTRFPKPDAKRLRFFSGIM